ncbi:putative oligopeptide transporter, OPT superfamily [Dioscorea sansibarensis]
MASGKLGDSTRLNADEPSVERNFESVEVPEWSEQLTPRAFCVCLIVGSFMTVLLMRLSLATSFILAGSMPPYVLSLLILRTWKIIMDTVGIFKNPITRQETAVMQSCLVGFFSIVYYGNFYFLPLFIFFFLSLNI